MKGQECIVQCKGSLYLILPDHMTANKPIKVELQLCAYYSCKLWLSTVVSYGLVQLLRD